MTTTAIATVPREDEALARVEQALRDGTRAHELVPATVLGLDAEEIARACDRSGEQPPVAEVNNWRRALSWRESQYLVQAGPVAACAPRRFPTEVFAQLQQQAQQRHWCLAFHSSGVYRPDSAHFAEYLSRLPAGWVSVIARSHMTGDALRLGRLSVASDPLRHEDFHGWTPIDLDGERVAYARPHPMHAGVIIWLGINPYQGRSVRGEPAGLSSRQAEQRTALLGRILDAAATMVGEHAWAASVPDERQQDIRRAVGVVQAVQAMAQAHTARQHQARMDASQRIQQSEHQVERLRTQLVETLREADEQRALLDALNAAAPAQEAQAAAEAMRSLGRIRDLAPVRDCEIVEQNRDLMMRISLHPYVFTPANGGASRRLLGNLTFSVSLTNTNGQLYWEPTATASPHPHVSSSGATCWGAAQIPLAEAVGRRDWVTMVVIITGWITQHNPRSEYTPINEFPTTDAPGGWVLPGKDDE